MLETVGIFFLGAVFFPGLRFVFRKTMDRAGWVNPEYHHMKIANAEHQLRLMEMHKTCHHLYANEVRKAHKGIERLKRKIKKLEAVNGD